MNPPEPPLPALKSVLREELRQRLRELAPHERDEASLRIRERCHDLPEWKAARVIALYHPTADEPDLWPLAERAWSEGRGVVLPAFEAATSAYRWSRVGGPDDLVPGRFGILEPGPHCQPVEAVSLDLVLVPGLGFSTDGGRLGRGRGFYDRLLESVGGRVFGVAFDFQLLPRIPREDHDVGLDGVITPSGCRYAPPGAPLTHGH